MAGIYIHIPFCRKACFYCDFHFSVSFKKKREIITAICQEIEGRKDFFEPTQSISSIYFGGGTPSVLSVEELDQILGTVYQCFQVDKAAEITFECNPDDLTQAYLTAIKFAGINRLSIGVQSFNDEHLQWMNRSHNASQSIRCVNDAALVGFKDITIDLIYGVPQLSNQEWTDTISKALRLPINHMSAYSLTMEENTPYAKLVNQKKYEKPEDDVASSHYAILTEQMQKHGWEHYEVSSFCKKGNFSRHNTGYWNGQPYLGIGPSAHSYSRTHRIWNVRDNASYIGCIQAGEDVSEMEELTANDHINERLLTGLRTQWGVNHQEIKRKYGYDILALFSEEIAYWISNQWLILEGEELRLTSAGFLFADHIASTLFAVGDYSSQTSS